MPYGYMLNKRQLPGASDTAASFQFDQEDHTLGNALRYMIMKKYALLAPPRNTPRLIAALGPAQRLNFADTPFPTLQKPR